MGINFTGNVHFSKVKIALCHTKRGENLFSYSVVKLQKRFFQLFNCRYLFNSSFCCVFSLFSCFTFLMYHLSRCFKSARRRSRKIKQKWSDNSYSFSWKWMMKTMRKFFAASLIFLRHKTRRFWERRSFFTFFLSLNKSKKHFELIKMSWRFKRCWKLLKSSKNDFQWFLNFQDLSKFKKRLKNVKNRWK